MIAPFGRYSRIEKGRDDALYMDLLFSYVKCLDILLMLRCGHDLSIHMLCWFEYNLNILFRASEHKLSHQSRLLSLADIVHTSHDGCLSKSYT